MQQLYDDTLRSIRENEAKNKYIPVHCKILKKPVLVWWDKTEHFYDESFALALTLGCVCDVSKFAEYIINIGSDLGYGMARGSLEDQIGVLLAGRRGRIGTPVQRISQGTTAHFMADYERSKRYIQQYIGSIQRVWDVEILEHVWITYNYEPDGGIPDDVIVMDIGVKTPQQWLDWWMETHEYEKLPTKCLVM